MRFVENTKTGLSVFTGIFFRYIENGIGQIPLQPTEHIQLTKTRSQINNCKIALTPSQWEDTDEACLMKELALLFDILFHSPRLHHCLLILEIDKIEDTIRAPQPGIASNSALSLETSNSWLWSLSTVIESNQLQT